MYEDMTIVESVGDKYELFHSWISSIMLRLPMYVT